MILITKSKSVAYRLLKANLVLPILETYEEQFESREKVLAGLHEHFQ